MSTPTEPGAQPARSTRLAAAIDRETLTLALGLAAAATLTLIFTTLSTRLLGPRAAGDFLSGVFALSFALTAAGPLGGTASRFAAQHRARGEDAALRALPRSLAVVAGLGIAGAGLLLALALVTDALAPGSLPLAWWLLTAWTALVLTLVSLARGMLRGLGRFFQFTESILVESGARLVLGLSLVWIFRSAAAGIAGYALAATLCLLVAWRRVGRALGPGSRSALEPGRHLAFLLPMGGMALVHGAQQNLDVLVVRGLFEADEAGAYGAAAILAQTATLLLTPFSTTLLPRAAGLHGRSRALGREGARLLLRHGAGYLALCLPLLLGFTWGGEGLIRLLFGPQFTAGGEWLAPIAASIVIGGLGLLVMQCLAAQGAFGFLLPATLGMALAFGWIVAAASGPADVAWILLRVKLVLLCALIALFLRSLARAPADAADEGARRAGGLNPSPAPSLGLGGGS